MRGDGSVGFLFACALNEVSQNNGIKQQTIILYFNWNLAFASLSLPGSYHPRCYQNSTPFSSQHCGEGVAGVQWQLVVAAARVHCNANYVYAMFASVGPITLTLSLSLSLLEPVKLLFAEIFVRLCLCVCVCVHSLTLSHCWHSKIIMKYEGSLWGLQQEIKPRTNLVSKMQLKSQPAWKKNVMRLCVCLNKKCMNVGMHMTNKLEDLSEDCNCLPSVSYLEFNN